MKKAYRYILRGIIILLSVFVLLWGILWCYVHFNKEGLISKIRSQVSKQIHGKVDIGDIDVHMVSSFPNISVKLHNVVIRDSMWDQHHRDFFKAEYLNARIRFFSIFSGKPVIGKVVVENATLNLYTDSLGRSNAVGAQGDVDEKKKTVHIPDLLFRNTRFIMEYPARNKLHDIFARELECNAVQAGGLLSLKVYINATVNGLGFNMEKGSYIKGKKIEGDFKVRLVDRKQLELDHVKLKVNGHPYIFNGAFHIGQPQPHFELDITAHKVPYKEIVGIFTQTAQPKLDKFDISEPVAIHALISGPMAYKSFPRVKVDLSLKRAKIQSPAGDFTECSFDGLFMNYVDSTIMPSDDNSKLQFRNLKATWQGLPLTSKMTEIYNIRLPILSCDLQSHFNLPDLNAIAGSNSIRFDKGTGALDVVYKGSIAKNDTLQVPTEVKGSVKINDATIVYQPRNLSFTSCSGNISFRDKDLFIEQLKAQAGNTSLTMNGSILNLFTLINKEPEKLQVDWNISTPILNINDFMNFIGRRSAATGKASKARLVKVAEKVDQMLASGMAKLNISAGKMMYKKFVASNVSAAVSLLNGQLLVNSAKLVHAGGTLSFTGSLSDAAAPGNNTSTMKLNGKLENIDIPGIFYGFNNFNQDAITSSNMKGKINADVAITGNLNHRSELMMNDMVGIVDFDIKNAELNNFEPLQKVSEVIFKKRDFSNVRFAELKSRLDISGSSIYLNKMEISSNVLTMFVEGVYDTKKGTDMDIRVPLRNLKKIDQEAQPKNTGKVGSNIRLRAKTGDDGKLKVKLVLFGKKDKGDD